MRRGFLRGWWVSAIALVTAASACGGKVVVDGMAGQGGSGGAGGAGGSGAGVPTTASVTTTGAVAPSGGMTTTTGGTMTCSCDEFCANIAACGGPGGDCQNFCDQVPPDLYACVCKTGGDCGALQDCLGNGPGGGPGSGGGGSGELPPACADCGNEVAEQQCEQQANSCFSKPACGQMFECHADCGWGPECSFCDQGPPGAVNSFNQLIACVVCGECFGDCATHPIINYCPDGD